MRIHLLLISLLCASTLASAEDSATIVVSGQKVDARTVGPNILLNASQVAEAHNWLGKSVDENIWVACRSDRCVPISLSEVVHDTADDVLWIEADALGRVLGFAIRVRNGELELIGAESASAVAAVTAYHADWGPGRGFKKGDTLPDVPLIDMDGNEVRFGQFLGKRYIIYGWASW